ncbi:Autoinducer 2 sensor kinase/phosphatase LuxQ [compost metagenome]
MQHLFIQNNQAMHSEKVVENTKPQYEALRLAKLMHYEILDTEAEYTFDRISHLATGIFKAPGAGICFEGNALLFQKSVVGHPPVNPKLPLCHNFNVVNEGGSSIITAPLQTPEGYLLGVIYVSTAEIIAPTETQTQMLSLLAEMVMDILASRIATRNAFRAYDDRLHVLIHDLKNPMTTISLQSELMGRIPAIDDKAVLIAGKINSQSKKMVDSLNEILIPAKKAAGGYKPEKAQIDLKEVLEAVKLNFDLPLKHKGQSISINIYEPILIFGDVNKLTVIFSQLIDNAIKFSPLGTAINISHQLTTTELTVSVNDQGVGLTTEDLDKIFTKFAPLSAKPTGTESANGFGLITAGAFIDMHKGKLWAESPGKDLGTTFYVKLPLR